MLNQRWAWYVCQSEPVVQAGRNLHVVSHAVGLLRKQIGKCSFCNDGRHRFVHSISRWLFMQSRCEFYDNKIYTSYRYTCTARPIQQRCCQIPIHWLEVVHQSTPKPGNRGFAWWSSQHLASLEISFGFDSRGLGEDILAAWEKAWNHSARGLLEWLMEPRPTWTLPWEASPQPGWRESWQLWRLGKCVCAIPSRLTWTDSNRRSPETSNPNWMFGWVVL